VSDPNERNEDILGALNDAEASDVAEMQVEERRSASLTLRQDAQRESLATSMEAATRSLSDAIRITYKLIIVLMIGLVALFAFSGFQQVEESQRGVKVSLGRITESSLGPGFHFSLPVPLGEVITIETTGETIVLDDAFYPAAAAAARNTPYPETSTQTQFNPSQDGFIITADQSLAVGQWRIDYQRTDPDAFLESLHPDEEQELIESVVQRAVVRVMSETSLDELFGGERDGEVQTAGGAAAATDAASQRIRRLAQDDLDRLGVGITIGTVQVADRIYPPKVVIDRFNRANSAVSAAEARRVEAETDANRALTTIAGSAYRPLIDLVDAYERQVDLGQLEEAEQTLQTLFAVFDGEYADRPLEWNGTNYGTVRVSGRVSSELAQAETYASGIVNRARRNARIFEAKLGQYRANPRFFVAREYFSAVLDLLDRNEATELFLLPENTDRFTLTINDDPEIQRRIEQEYNRVQRNQAERERLERLGIDPDDVN
jgi:regulator of protease activity HflC (stomatin/prohibitin superfamily)